VRKDLIESAAKLPRSPDNPGETGDSEPEQSAQWLRRYHANLLECFSRGCRQR